MKKPDLRVVEEPALNNLDRIVIGGAVRIHIPFDDLLALREYAGLLRGLADDIDFAARRTDHPALDSPDYQPWRRQLLFYLKFRAGLINREIRDLHQRRHRKAKKL